MVNILILWLRVDLKEEDVLLLLRGLFVVKKMKIFFVIDLFDMDW